MQRSARRLAVLARRGRMSCNWFAVGEDGGRTRPVAEVRTGRGRRQLVVTEGGISWGRGGHRTVCPTGGGTRSRTGIERGHTTRIRNMEGGQCAERKEASARASTGREEPESTNTGRSERVIAAPCSQGRRSAARYTRSSAVYDMVGLRRCKSDAGPPRPTGYQRPVPSTSRAGAGRASTLMSKPRIYIKIL